MQSTRKRLRNSSSLTNDFDNLLSSTDMPYGVSRSRPKHSVLHTEGHGDFQFQPRGHWSQVRYLHQQTSFSVFVERPPEVLHSCRMIEREVVDQRGISIFDAYLAYMMSGKSSGVVISLLDISARSSEGVTTAKFPTNALNELSRQPATASGIGQTFEKTKCGVRPCVMNCSVIETRNFHRRYSSWLALIHPEDRDRVRQSTSPHQRVLCRAAPFDLCIECSTRQASIDGISIAP